MIEPQAIPVLHGALLAQRSLGCDTKPDIAGTSAARIGAPRAELALVRAVLREADTVLPPGRGRITIALSEVELGLGRPDVLLATASPARLRKRLRNRVVIQNWQEARALAAIIQDEVLEGVTRKHARALHRRLRARGWSQEVAETVRIVSADAVLVEAKVKDWRTGLAQVARARAWFPKSALLVPKSVARRVPRVILDSHAVGLLAYDGVSTQWVRKPPRRVPSLAARLWLDELVIRHIERTGAFRTTRPLRTHPLHDESTRPLAHRMERSPRDPLHRVV